MIALSWEVASYFIIGVKYIQRVSIEVFSGEVLVGLIMVR